MTQLTIKLSGACTELTGCIYANSNNFELCSFILEDKRDVDSDLVFLKDNEIKEYISKSSHIIIEADIKTALPQSQRYKGNYGITFDIGVFLNISEDHISEKEHENMQEYFESKMKLFDMCKYAYINSDNIYTAKVPEIIKDKCKVETYGIDNFENSAYYEKSTSSFSSSSSWDDDSDYDLDSSSSWDSDYTDWDSDW